MIAKRPLILVSNDDGVFAKGLVELYTALRDLGDIVVIAPDGPRSGASSAITTSVPIHYNLVLTEPGLTIYSCSGTPADCVKLALNEIVPVLPNLVVAGINHGGNEGIAVNYSGTLGAAIEGTIFGIPSFAVSLIDGKQESDYLDSCRFARSIARKILKEGLPKGVYLNVNVPCVPEVRGLRVCSQAEGRYVGEYVRQTTPTGRDVYWLSGEIQLSEPVNQNWDVPLIDKGYATLVPCNIDVTDYEFIQNIKHWDE
ncbi:5'/3'-nucleotidase SurE [Porphyromonas levii]|uniref:5'-nucleotidase SurE n=1 Tax=Porphyromonas levii TaxID=28114 RepID=A0A4Y8WSD7_9PORP|nr:5'/3'-nucleotidase SurE [Porphyromonas levii]MBR8702815.1 5'-nucleotidase SurE [Porphyromonas levii]MBR8712389.1 5'-nucleotidase SurE [Porphyromonas levii]MBR8714440.1 5'-nucleotidase SurE [Porphyromonas levii]MBR8726981.1 5'-nucleotidase SurE [Porphyromonas levii]MBR8728856.1 5'-nucleotidase SurE [Porphyromonas levii]